MPEAGFSTRIIIGGMPRAGTTLFRCVLDASEHIICGPETTFFLRPLSIQQQQTKRIARRIDRALEIGEDVIAQAITDARTSFEAFDTIMARYAEHAGVTKSGWAEKSPWNCSAYNWLALENPDAFFISLIRDGRDVVTSIVNERKGYHVPIQRYVEVMRMVHTFEHPRHLIVRYEDMVKDPKACFRDVFSSCGLPFDNAVLEQYRESTTTRDPAKVNQPRMREPINADVVARWKRPEHAARIAAFMADKRAVNWLEHSGYLEPEMQTKS